MSNSLEAAARANEEAKGSAKFQAAVKAAKTGASAAETGALRYDDGKPTFHHIHLDVLLLEYGKGLANKLMFRWYFYGEKIPLTFLCKLMKCDGMFRVLDFGAQKYASLNYSKGMKYSRVFNSWLRHTYSRGPDAESFLPHKYHAACNILFAITYQVLGYDGGPFDDRPKGLK